jgi:8-amino-7-oxononanoate synthase
MIATLSKAAGVVGGAVCGSKAFCDALVNHGRAYIYSTAVPSMVAAGVEAAIGVMRDEPHRQARVRLLARRVRERLSSAGLAPPPGDSPIIPVVLGSESAALKAADYLLQEGLLVIAVRPPTVPRGSSRLRVSLSCDHSDEEVERLTQGLIHLAGGGG